MYDGLKEFDIVLFRKNGGWFTDFIGSAIQWCQKGMGCKSPEFVHVGVAMQRDGELKIFETNPPSARWRELNSVDWDNVAVLSMSSSVRVSQSASRVVRAWCEAKVGFKYDYGAIGGFLWLGMRGRLFRKSTRAKMFKENKVASASRDVCSQLVDNIFGKPLGMDVVPTIGNESLVPGDLTLAKHHFLVYGRLGS